MKLPVITISREYGSGGRAIGEKVAEALNIPFYDNDRIYEMAKASGAEEMVRKTERMKATSFLYGLYMNATQQPTKDDLFELQSQVIQKVAEEGPCVLVGRCADYILRDRDDLLSVFIHAPLEFRVERARTAYQIDTDNIEAHVKKQDRNRANFYNHITDRKWGDANSFHFAMSSVYGIDFSAEVLKHAAMHFLAHQDENPEM